MGHASVNDRLRAQNTALLIWLTACLKRLPEQALKLHKDELGRYTDEIAKQNEGEYINALEEGDYITLLFQEVPRIVTPEGQPAFQNKPLASVEAISEAAKPVAQQCENGMCGACETCLSDD